MKEHHTNRVKIITSNKPNRRGEYFITLDGVFVVKVYNIVGARLIVDAIADALHHGPTEAQRVKDENRRGPWPIMDTDKRPDGPKD